MTKYFKNGKEVTRDQFISSAKGFDFNKGFPSIGSFQPFQSPIDGSIITNRHQLSDHCKKHDVVQVGDEFKNKRKGD